NFTQALPELVGGFKYLIAGGDGAHNLYQLHQRYRIEKVQPNKAILPLRGSGNLRDGNRRSVAGKDCVFLDDGVERRESLLLLSQVLDDGFNDDVAVGQVLRIGGAFEPRTNGLHWLFQSALLDKFGERLLNSGKAFIKEFLILLHYSYVVTSSSADLGDAGTHQATAENSNFLDSH